LLTRLFLIRHGETDWNVEGRWQGHADVPLNARGRLQSMRMAQFLANCGLTAIYSSDLVRARQTAEILAAMTGLPLYLDPRLREIDQGEWEGLLVSDIQSRYTTLLQQRRQDPWHVAPPGGETGLQVRARVLAAIEEILKMHPQENVAVVSHGFALSLVIAHYQGYPISRVWDLIPGNCEWVELEISHPVDA
jgi:broad specificity phosphatase PhoE